MRLTNRKTHFTERIPLLSIRSIRTDRHMAYTDRYGAGVLDNPPLIMKCPKCFWYDNYKICPICDHRIPEERKYIKEGFLRCHDCGLITHKSAKTLETNFYSPSKEENEEDD